MATEPARESRAVPASGNAGATKRVNAETKKGSGVVNDGNPCPHFRSQRRNDPVAIKR